MTRARVALSGIVALLLVWTLLIAWARWEVGEVPGDYLCFDRAASRFLAGEPLYVREWDHFDSPPYFVWLTLPAHALGTIGGDALATIAGLLLSALALVLVRRSIAPTPSPEAMLAAALYVPLWLSAAIGQWGGAFFAVMAGGLFFATRRRPLEAGLVLSLLLAKPPLAIFVLPIVAIGLGRRAIAGIAIGTLLWALLSLPLGAHVWSEWLDQIAWAQTPQAIALHRWQHHTLLGSFRALGSLLSLAPGVVRLAWLVIAVPLGVAAVVAASRLLRAGEVAAGVAIAVLATIALGPYLRYYDSQIVLIPTLVLLSRPQRSKMAGGLALAYLLLASLDAAYFQEQAQVPVEGILATGWLVLALRDALRSAPSRLQRTAIDPVVP